MRNHITRKLLSAGRDYVLLRPAPETPEELLILPAEEKEAVDYIESLIVRGFSGTEEKIACDFLSTVRIRYLTTICTSESYPGIRRFCEENPILRNCWKRRLIEHTHPDFAYSFVDKSGGVSELSMLLACYYNARFNDWNKQGQGAQCIRHQEIFLELASARGDPFALREREKRSARMLTMLCQTVREREPEDFIIVVQRMLAMAEEWGNRCWSPGFFSAGVILEESAVELANLQWQKSELEDLTLPVPEDEYPLCLQLMIGAMRCYYAALLLLQSENSVRIMKVVSPGGYFSGNTPLDWGVLQKSILRNLERVFKLSAPKKLVDTIFSQVMVKFGQVPETLDELRMLPAAEKHAVDHIESLIVQGLRQEEEKTACEYLSKARVQSLIAICTSESYPGIRRFCQENPMLLTCWKERLREYSPLDFAVSCVDGSGGADELDMLFACCFYRLYNLWSCLEQQEQYHVGQPSVFLDLACTNGNFYAHRERIASYACALSAFCRAARREGGYHLASVEVLTAVIKKMPEIAEAWGNCGWSPGYFAAGVMLEKAALELAANQGQKIALSQLTLPAPEDQYPLCLQLMVGAMRCYYSAWLLSDRENSVRIMKVIFPDGYFYEDMPLDWSDLRQSIFYKLEKVFKLSVPVILVDGIQSEVMEKLAPLLPETDSENVTHAHEAQSLITKRPA